jgi:hypothetical protein
VCGKLQSEPPTLEHEGRAKLWTKQCIASVDVPAKTTYSQLRTRFTKGHDNIMSMYALVIIRIIRLFHVCLSLVGRTQHPSHVALSAP